MTRITPLRFTILQFSQSFFTDARTFIKLFVFYYDEALRQVVRRHLNIHHVSQRHPLEAQTPSARHMRQQPVPIYQFNPIKHVRQNLYDFAHSLDGVFSGHVNISGSDSVTNIECSK